MSATCINAAVLLVSLALVCTSSGQPSLGEPLKSEVLQSVLESLTKGNTTNDTSTGNDTSSQNSPHIPRTLGAIIGFLASRGHRISLDIGSGSAETNLTLNINTSRLLDRFLGSPENSSETVANVTSEVGQGDNPTTPPLTTTTTTVQMTQASRGTSGLPERPESTENTRTVRVELSSVAHTPDWEAPHGDSSGPHADPGAANGVANLEKNPTIEQVEEPVEPSTDENVQQGSLPLVLGAAIVVIFGVGVAGAAISKACRKKKKADEDTVSESSSSDIEVERGMDNPMFTNKSTSNLTLVASSFPPNSLLYKEMRYPSPTLPLY